MLSTLLASPAINTLDILARRQPPKVPSDDTKARTFVDQDTTKWVPHLRTQAPAPQIFFSALATTRAAAGGFDKQYKMEHDLNVELAKAAKEAGSKVYVLISSVGANKNASMSAYFKMKGEIEEDIKAMGFENMVIVRPGLIAGKREESRPAEAVLRVVAGALGKINTQYLKDWWAQDADVIARAAVSAGLMAANEKVPSKVWEIAGADIVRLGRTEWKES